VSAPTALIPSAAGYSLVRLGLLAHTAEFWLSTPPSRLANHSGRSLVDPGLRLGGPLVDDEEAVRHCGPSLLQQTAERVVVETVGGHPFTPTAQVPLVIGV